MFQYWKVEAKRIIKLSSPVAAVLVFWNREPPKPANAPPRDRPVGAVVVVAAVPPKFNVNPLEPAMKRKYA